MNLDLADVWNRLVGRGMVKNIFTDKAGRQIEAGVRIGPTGPEPYAVLADSGLDVYEPANTKRLDSGIEIYFNPVGNMKPIAIAADFVGKQEELSAEANECKLGCQDSKLPLSVLTRNFLLQVYFSNSEWRAIPNVAPWEPRGLILWIPCETKDGITKLPHQPQVLTRAALEDFLEISQASENTITFFTSLPGASANHLHFQTVYCDRKMAVESADRVKIGNYTALKGYPANGLVFLSNVGANELWQIIEKIQTAGYPYNLIALASGIFLFVRKPEHGIVEEFPGRPIGAMEFIGHINTSFIEDLERINDELVTAAYAKATVDAETLIKLLA